MPISPSILLKLVWATLSAPKYAGVQVLAFRPSLQARWLGFALVVVISVFFGQLSAMMLGEEILGLPSNPFVSTAFQASVMLTIIGLSYVVARLFGGKGRLEDTLLLVSWLQFTMIALQLLQLVALVLFPPFAGMIGIVAMVLFLWILANFITLLHGFDKVWGVVAGVVFCFFLVALVASYFLIVMGFGPSEVLINV
jgi:hypothetical protein